MLARETPIKTPVSKFALNENYVVSRKFEKARFRKLRSFTSSKRRDFENYSSCKTQRFVNNARTVAFSILEITCMIMTISDKHVGFVSSEMRELNLVTVGI